MTDPRALEARWLGRVPYARAVGIQEELVRSRRRGEAPDTLLLLEHPPVITLGRGANVEHVRIAPAEREVRGIDLQECGRGGDVTFHGPGQLVAYPVVLLSGPRRDVHRYLRDLEQALILTVADFGIRAERIPGLTGVWVDGRKLAAIGVRLSTGWITSHGFALNVNIDLSGFETIVPCGIKDRSVTSMKEILGHEIPLEEVASRAAVRTAETLGLVA